MIYSRLLHVITATFNSVALRWLLAAAVVVAWGWAVQPLPAPAKSAEERLDAVEERIGHAEQREGVLTTEIDALGDEISALTTQVADLRGQEAAAEAELASRESELDRAESELQAALDELDSLRDRLKRALVELRDRLIAIYMSGAPNLSTIMVTAQTYGDMVATVEYLEAIRESDAALAERVRVLRDETKRLVAVRREAKVTIETARDAIAAEEARLESTRATLEAREGQLVARRDERQARLGSIRGAIHQHEEVAADLRAKIEAQIAAATSSPSLPMGPVPTPSASGLIWPIDGILTSTFGPRWGSMHEGIDISAAEGTPIRAADSGTVILLQSESESGGYGNYICIDHGGGLATCYAHLSGFATSSGARLEQGSMIGYVGNTGHSFGAHLHFEVRINGSATDPLGYL